MTERAACKRTGKQGKGKVKGEGKLSDEGTSGNERLDERKRSSAKFGMQRQRVGWFGEQSLPSWTRGTYPHMSTVQADDRPIC